METLRQVIRDYKFWLMVSLLLSLSLIGMAILGEDGFLRVQALEQELQAVQARVQALREENTLLRQEVYALKHDPYFIEKLAREELGLVRPGEIVFQFVDTPREGRERP